MMPQVLMGHGRSIGQFYHFQISEAPILYGETNQCPHLVKAIKSGSSRIDVQHPQRLVIFHLQDVGVSTDEKPGRTCHKATGNRRVIATRITTDMLHQYFYIAIYSKAQRLWESPSQFLSVNVAIHGTQGTESR